MAVRLAQEGARVWAVDRDADRLHETLDRASKLLNAVPRIAPTRALQQALLVDNPQAPYRFGAAQV
jgi:NADP-dependent 3-hydroxy acid dehydrogenase YdfG